MKKTIFLTILLFGLIALLGISKSNASKVGGEVSFIATPGYGSELLNDEEGYYVQITWSKSRSVTAVDLSYSIDEGNSWTSIATELSGESYDWYLFDDLCETQTVKMKINDSDYAPTRDVSESFTATSNYACGDASHPTTETSDSSFGVKGVIKKVSPFSRPTINR